MIYLLDTNALTDMVTQQPQFATWIAALQPDDRIIICTIVRGEVLFGLGKLPPGKRRDEINSRRVAHRGLQRQEATSEGRLAASSQQSDAHAGRLLALRSRSC